MRLSIKNRFAVTAMIDIGRRQHQGPVPLAAISQRQNISISYLEQMFSKMRQQGLVDSTRGPGGGYTLGRDARDISVADIVSAVNPSHRKKPLSSDSAQHESASTDALWSQLNQKIEEHLRDISLHSLMSDQPFHDLDVPQGSPKRGVYPQKTQQRPSVALNSVFALGRSLAEGH